MYLCVGGVYIPVCEWCACTYLHCMCLLQIRSTTSVHHSKYCVHRSVRHLLVCAVYAVHCPSVSQSCMRAHQKILQCRCNSLG